MRERGLCLYVCVKARKGGSDRQITGLTQTYPHTPWTKTILSHIDNCAGTSRPCLQYYTIFFFFFACKGGKQEIQTSDRAVIESTELNQDTENMKRNHHAHQPIECVCVCPRATERVLWGWGGRSLDRLGAPASLHILSSSVVCWGSSDYWTTLNTRAHTNTHKLKNKGIYIHAHNQVKAMQMWRDNYIATTHIHTHQRDAPSSISVSERHRHKDTLILT